MSPRGTIDPNNPRWNGDGFKSKLGTTYEAAGVKFIALFQFRNEDNKLFRVNLRPLSQSDCGNVRMALISIYGQPENSRNMRYASLDQWRDEKSGNLIDYVVIGDCEVNYRELLTSKSGL